MKARVLVTGPNGFIAKNLMVHLLFHGFSVESLGRNDSLASIDWNSIDFIFHLAGANRPVGVSGFMQDNADLTLNLCQHLNQHFNQTGKTIPVLYTSSIQVERDNEYGKSKLMAESHLELLHQKTQTPVLVYRLVNVFGKWAKPNYNSAVATFCHNIQRDLPIEIHDPKAKISLVYVDDVVESFMHHLSTKPSRLTYQQVTPVYCVEVGELADILNRFKNIPETYQVEHVGVGLERALYATYLSYSTPQNFAYGLKSYDDARGRFVEVLKTSDSGQFSYFTAKPGVTRGGHYHHTKNEKFLVVKGRALFKFRHILTKEYYELHTNSDQPVVVKTVPGWTHDITNVGEEDMLVLLWGNEIFDRNKPDTYALPV